MHKAAGSPIAPVELRVDELLLRPWRGDAVDAVWEACQDPEIQRWTTVPSPYTRDDAEWWVGGSAERWASGEATFACVDAGTGALLASFGLHDAGDEGGPMVGYWVAGPARGRRPGRPRARRAPRGTRRRWRTGPARTLTGHARSPARPAPAAQGGSW